MMLTATLALLGAGAEQLPPWLLDRTPGGSWHGGGAASGGWGQDAAGAWVGTGTNRRQTWRRTPAGAWVSSGTVSNGTGRVEQWTQTAGGAWVGSGAGSGQVGQAGPDGSWRDRGRAAGAAWRPPRFQESI
jgi:hypothetical protein